LRAKRSVAKQSQDIGIASFRFAAFAMTNFGSFISCSTLICSQNKLRSPTAEAVFSEYEGLEVESAGLNHDAEVPLSVEMLQEADIIFVMEKVHKSKLSKKFKPYLKGQKIICLDIPDNYDYMDADLIKILKNKVLPFLGSY
jgi:predicted protein tyrosine phosphatase